MFDSQRKRAGRDRGRGMAMVGTLGVGAFLGATALAAPAGAIIGGTDATEEYGFMTALYNDNGVHMCGGALVDEQWVLTAGHCTEPEQLTVRVGSNDHREGGSEREVTEVIEHPEYEGTLEVLRNDLALLKLDAPVEQEPIAIAGESAAPDTAMRVLGWGMVDELGQEDKPDILQELDSEIVDIDRCAEVDPEGDLCSEHPTDEAQVCVTDSGGPAVRGEEGDWELVGVVSRDGDFATNPACVGPAVFTNPVAHAGWITGTIEGETAPAASAPLVSAP